MGRGAEGSEMISPHAEGFTVKNTFIEFEDDCFEEDDGFDNALQGIHRKRQVSEPAFLFGRQHSSKPSLRALQEEEEHDAIGVRPTGDAASTSTRPSGSDGDGEEEPETETEPAQVYGFGISALNPMVCGAAAAAVVAGSSMLNKDAAPWPQVATFWGGAPNPTDTMDSLSSGGDAGQAFETDFQQRSPGFGGQGMLVAQLPAPTQDVPAEWGETTTVMMRNLPNRYTQHMLVEEISSVGFSGVFDFLYLPIDPETNANKGYAFMNFTDNVSSWRFKMNFEGKQMSRFNSSKYVSVSPAALQGFEANYAHYSTARCSRGDPAARPLFLREPQQALTSRAGTGPARRGGQRRRNNGRSLVDVAVQKQYAHQPHADMAAAAPMPMPPRPLQHRQQQQQQQQQPAASCSGGEADVVPRFCPYCGGAMQPSHRFCQFCGNSLAGLASK